MSIWRKLTEFLAGPADPFDREVADCGPGHRVDDADFAMALIGLGAKMAKADGFVTDSEVSAFQQVFRAPPDGEIAIERAFHLAQQTTLGFEGYARRLARRFRAHSAVLEDVLDGLFHIAKADGAVTASEETYLQAVADIFGFSEREFQRIRMAHLGADDDDPYVILGVDPDISDEGLKRAYRRIAAQNHPDAMVARGAPVQLQRLANSKMSAINAAYARIRADRGSQTSESR
tara:strand:+ start:278 stop:976 length:699 start_codon:yes stop_codon:yes gene_type:complete